MKSTKDLREFVLCRVAMRRPFSDVPQVRGYDLICDCFVDLGFDKLTA